jgi:hypothetical protein
MGSMARCSGTVVAAALWEGRAYYNPRTPQNRHLNQKTVPVYFADNVQIENHPSTSKLGKL